MAEAYEVQIADAIVGELNSPGRGWLRPFTARRYWLPNYSSEELQTLQVAVVPVGIGELVKQSRQPVNQWQYTIAVDFQQVVQTATPTDLDALTKTAEQVHDFFADWHHLAGLDGWKVMGALREDVYFFGQLVEHSLWETMIELTVQGYR